MTAQDFQTLANWIGTTTPATVLSNELRDRCAASKIYYATFHAVTEFLESIGIFTRLRDVYAPHSVVAQIFYKSTENIRGTQPVVYRLGETLRRLHWLRAEADYELTPSFTYTKRKEAFSKAKSIEDDLASLQPNGVVDEGVKRLLRKYVTDRQADRNCPDNWAAIRVR